MSCLDDKVAIVTGSSRGIGKAIAIEFARHGASIVVNALASEDRANGVAAQIRDAGARATVVMADVRLRSDADRLVAAGIEAFGQVDILVSNAGVIIDKPFVESSMDDWTSAMETNLLGFFNAVQAVLPHMTKRGYGRIIATGSCITEVADLGANHFAVCAASKGGIGALLRPLAAEVARQGITVNAVSPGYIATEMLDEVDAAGLEDALKLVPMRRYGKPGEIAAAMRFLASDDAAYITGQTLRVNGGMSMG